MSKKVQAIIAGSIVLVLLAGALVALILTNKPADGEESTSSTLGSDLITLMEGSQEELENITVKNSDDEYKIELLGENLWGIKELVDFKYSKDMYDTTISSSLNLYASEIIEENAADISIYGFDKPSLITEIKFKGKDAFKFTLGDLSPDKYTRYIIKTGEKTVYGVSASTLSNLMLTKYDYLDKTVTPALEADESGNPVLPKYNEIKINTKDLEVPIVLEQYKIGEMSENSVSGSGLKMTSPEYGMFNENTSSTDRLTSFFGITASEIVAINPTAADLTKYGFDDPTSSLSMVYNETSTINLITGLPIECQHEEDEDLSNHKHVIESYYVTDQLKQIVYVVPVESIKWIDVKRNTFLSKMAVIPPILDIDGVDFTVDGKEYAIKYIFLEPTSSSASSDAKLDTNEMEATVNGVKVDIDASKKMLQLFYATSIQDFTDIEVTKPADASLVYHYKDGKTDKVEFYVLEDRTIVVSLNGNKAYIGRSGYIEAMKKGMENLLAGNPVATDW